MTAARCRAKGGPARCNKANCPARRAARAGEFTGPALGGFGDPTGFPFHELTETERFHKAVVSAIDVALVEYPDREQEMEATSYAASLVRDAYPVGSQALHMMNHNTGVLGSWVNGALENVYDARGIW